MPRKKILLQTNAPWLMTGLGENGRALMRYLARSDKYELVYYCTQVLSNDANLSRLPVKAYGAIPADQNILNQLNQDPGRARDVAYGSWFVDQIVKDEKIDIYLGSDDIWGFNGYHAKPWWKQVNSLLHITIDSLPILEQAYEQAKETKHFSTWAKFAANEMHRRGPEFSHVQPIYGAFDISHFAPVSRQDKLDLRKRFGIDPDTTIFFYMSRNQLRKQFPQIVEAFAAFKREHPTAKAKLHFHTSVSEKGNGWDIPRLMQYHGVKVEDVLFTYVCKSCGQWEVRPYGGEDLDCRFCGASKSMVTASIVHGVPDDEMKLLHGLADCSVNAISSGGLERGIVTSLLCGLPTAATNYSSGEDFCAQPFVHTLAWTPYYEQGTNFKKSTTSVSAIKHYMTKVWRMSEREKAAIGEESRDWAAKTFSIDTIGRQWEAIFDTLPAKDWSTISLTDKPKNPDAPIPQAANNEEWVKSLYNSVLLVEPDPDGFKHWLQALERGITRDQIYQFFVGRAREENAKNAPPQDFGTLFDSNGRKRILFVIKESGGDVFICTALFPELKRLYPEADLYVATEPRFFDILAGNPHIHKVLAYHPAMEAELQMRFYADYYYYPALATQRQLAYLTRDKIGLELNALDYPLRGFGEIEQLQTKETT